MKYFSYLYKNVFLKTIMYTTCSNIGYNGRLGNQMFQMASVIGVGRKNNLTPIFPLQNNREERQQPLFGGQTIQVKWDIPDIFDIPEKYIKENLSDLSFHRVKEEGFEYRDYILEDPEKHYDMEGYFQSEKYFLHVESEIQEVFSFKEEIKRKGFEILEKIPLTGRKVAVHLRRGDYKNNSFHETITEQYYSNAFQYFLSPEESYEFLIFSDDIPYAKYMFGEQENIHYIDSKDQGVDLFIMTQCQDFIIANSSFSWWGAWLSREQNKRVFTPDKWFGEVVKLNYEDVYCKEWIKVKV